MTIKRFNLGYDEERIKRFSEKNNISIKESIEWIFLTREQIIPIIKKVGKYYDSKKQFAWIEICIDDTFYAFEIKYKDVSDKIFDEQYPISSNAISILLNSSFPFSSETKKDLEKLYYAVMNFEATWMKPKNKHAALAAMKFIKKKNISIKVKKLPLP